MEKIVCGGNYTTNLIKDNINDLIDESVLVRGDVTTLQTDVVALEGDVTTLQTDSTSLRTDVDGLKENTTLYNGIKTLPQIEGTALNVKGFYADTSVGGGQFYYDPLKDKADHNGGTVIAPEALVAWDGTQGDLATLLDWTGSGSGCFVRLNSNFEIDTEIFGYHSSLSPVNMYACINSTFASCINKKMTVKLPEDNITLNSAQPVKVGANTTVLGGKGIITPVFETPQPPASSAQEGNNFKAYGGVFVTCDLSTGYRYSESFYPDMGVIRFIDVKIANTTGLVTDIDHTLHGVYTHGGVVIFDNCSVVDMPNNGGACSMFRRVHVVGSCDFSRNGLTAPLGASRNGFSVTSTWSFPTSTFPPEDVSTMFTCENSLFRYNEDEGIKYGNVPFTYIVGNDCRYNKDRGIEGDNGEQHTQRYRDNDQIHIYNNDCRGVDGVSNYSITCNDGWNKDVYLSGNVMGHCKNQMLFVNARDEGSLTFTGKNTFYSSITNITNQASAIWVDAGRVNLEAGFDIIGDLDVTTEGSLSVLSVNNGISTGADVSISNINSNTKYTYLINGKIKDTLSVTDINCDVGKSAIAVTLTSPNSNITVSGYNSKMNSDAASDQGLLRLSGAASNPIGKLKLFNNTPSLTGVTTYPVQIIGGGSDTIAELYSSLNYWHGFSQPFGARITSDANNATLISTMDLPLLV